jgi:hypothetical protein
MGDLNSFLENKMEQQNDAGEPAKGPGCPAKWAALVDDEVVWAPARRVQAMVLLEQAGEEGKVLVRDHNSPNDVLIGKDDEVDLANGNVFYALGEAEAKPRGECHEPAKLAYFVDDRPEIVTRPEQTGSTLRSLFHLQNNVRLIRDLESRDDVEIAPNDSATFRDGPVFYTREVEHHLAITVNARVFTDKDGVKEKMTGKDIAKLVYPENANETTVHEISPKARDIALTLDLHICGGEVFEVVRKSVTGGFTNERVEREISELTKSGQKITVVNTPVNAVIYHALRTKTGAPAPTTDVLVLIPGSYPGQLIDGAYLPDNSPLIGKVKGEAQQTFVQADGRRWRLISYHPHNGGGGPAWNPGIYGFHTYITELLSWLYDLR